MSESGGAMPLCRREGGWGGRLRGAAWLVAMAMLIGCAAAAQAVVYDDITVSARSPEQAQTMHGYAEYRVTISNRSPSEKHRVELILPGHGGAQGIREIRRTVEVPARTVVEVPLLQPPARMWGHAVQVRIDGDLQDRSVSITTANHGQWDYYYHRGSQPYALVGRGVSGDAVDRFNEDIWRALTGATPAPAHAGPYGGSPHMPSHAYRGVDLAVRAEAETAGWSENWLAYTRWDSVVLSEAEWHTAPEPVRDALWRYVYAGGSLIVFGRIEPPEGWRGPATRPLPDDLSIAEHTVGFGAIWCIDPRNAEGVTENASLSTDSMASWTDDHWRAVHRFWNETAQPWQHRPSPQDANRQFPVIEELGIPARGMLILMIVFALAIGPLNLVAVDRMKRRVWLLWTSPLIALLFSGAVFGYALFAEGWSAEGRTAQFTLLDQRHRLATTLARTAYYAPLTPSGGLHFARDTEITPGSAVEPWSGGGTALSLDLTIDQHLTSGWVAARVPTHLTLRKVETRRERLQVSRNEAGELVVVNGLGANVRRLLVADEDRTVYEAENIAAGAKVTLTPTGERAGRAQPALRANVYRHDWLRAIDGAGAPEALARESYVAVLDEAVFVEPGLQNLSKYRQQAVVYGLLEEIRVGD